MRRVGGEGGGKSRSRRQIGKRGGELRGGWTRRRVGGEEGAKKEDGGEEKMGEEGGGRVEERGALIDMNSLGGRGGMRCF